MEGGFETTVTVEEAKSDGPRRAQRPQALAWGLAVLVAGATIGALATWGVMRPAPSRVVRFTVSPDADQSITIMVSSSDIAISPDGETIAYMTGGSVNEAARLHVRQLDQLQPRTLVSEGTVAFPFFSPDGQSVGFYDNREPAVLMRVNIRGGPPLSICEIPGNTDMRGASWGDDDTIIYGTQEAGSGLWRVSASGGQPELLTTPDPDRSQAHS